MDDYNGVPITIEGKLSRNKLFTMFQKDDRCARGYFRKTITFQKRAQPLKFDGIKRTYD